MNREAQIASMLIVAFAVAFVGWAPCATRIRADLQGRPAPYCVTTTAVVASRIRSIAERPTMTQPLLTPREHRVKVRSHWPKTEILLRGDSHYCTPETIDFCRANGLDFIFGVAPTSTLRAHILALEAKATAMFEAAPKNGKVRRFKEFFDGAQSWSRVERIVARVEAGADGPDTRFVVTNLTTRNARRLYEDVYCRRGQAENHIKSWKTHLAADRTSCMKASANQLRLFLHAGAYWLMWGLRQSMPRRSMWRVAQFDTLRLRLIKIAARVVEMKTMIRVHLPSSCCGQDILRFALEKIPRLAT